MISSLSSYARYIFDPKLILMTGLGASSGLPFLLVFSTLSVWLRESGISRTEIGLLSWVGMAYTLKFAWAPFIDTWSVPILERFVGRLRAWMILSQIVVAVGLIGLGSGSPTESTTLMALWALVVAFGSATQDITVDAWRIRAAPGSEQGNMAAAYQIGYRFGLIAAGAGTLYIADLSSFRVAYSVMAALMSVGVVCAFIAREPLAEGAAAPRDLKSSVLDLFRRKGAGILLVLAIVALYRIPDFVGGVMANTLYVDIGFSKTDIANVSKVYGIIIGLLGAVVGGVAVFRMGLVAALVFGCVVASASNLMFAWLALEGARYDLFVAAVGIENFSSGLAGTVLIAYMSAQVSLSYAATQYALLSSFFALPGKFLGGLSGVMVDALGYPFFYCTTALMGLPAILLCLLLPVIEGKRVEEAAH